MPSVVERLNRAIGEGREIRVTLIDSTVVRLYRRNRRWTLRYRVADTHEAVSYGDEAWAMTFPADSDVYIVVGTGPKDTFADPGVSGHVLIRADEVERISTRRPITDEQAERDCRFMRVRSGLRHRGAPVLRPPPRDRAS